MPWPPARRSCCARTEPTGLPSHPRPARVPSRLVTAAPVVSFLVSNEAQQDRIWAYLNRRSEHGLGLFAAKAPIRAAKASCLTRERSLVRTQPHASLAPLLLGCFYPPRRVPPPPAPAVGLGSGEPRGASVARPKRA